MSSPHCDLRGYFTSLDLLFLSVVSRVRGDMELGGVQLLVWPLLLKGRESISIGSCWAGGL